MMHFFKYIGISLFTFFISASTISAQEDYQLLTNLPIGTAGSVGRDPEGFSSFVNNIISISISAASVIAVIMVIAGGIQYMTAEAGGSKENAKKRIRNAIGGLILALTSFLILNTINPNLVNIQGIQSDGFAVFERPTETGWYYQYLSGTDRGWNGAHTTKEKCEDERSKEPDERPVSPCEEILNQKDTKSSCFFEEEPSMFDLARCYRTLDRCEEASKDRGDVVVSCRDYEEDYLVRQHCVNYDPFSLVPGEGRKEACYPNQKACEQAEAYIEDTGRDINDSCRITDPPSGNEEAQFCVQQFGPFGMTVTCNEEWNGNISSCEGFVSDMERLHGSDYGACYSNPAYGGGNTPLSSLEETAGYAPYEQCFSVQTSGGKDMCTKATKSGCEDILSTFTALSDEYDEGSWGACARKGYTPGAYKDMIFIDPCSNCQNIDDVAINNIPIKPGVNKILNAELLGKLDSFTADIKGLEYSDSPTSTSTKTIGDNWRITEAWPATVRHISTCHRNGTCADMNYTGEALQTASAKSTLPGVSLALIADTMRIARDKGLCLVWETNDDKRHFALTSPPVSDGYEDTVIDNIKYLEGITAPHFSVYLDNSGNCKQ